MERQIDITQDTKYPWDKAPGKVITEEGIHLITAKSQLRIGKDGEHPEVWAPSLYQSSMNPDYIEIRTLEILIKGNHWKISTRYGSQIVDITKENIKITDWKAEIHKTDCRKCENCGRCGW